MIVRQAFYSKRIVHKYQPLLEAYAEKEAGEGGEGGRGGGVMRRIPSANPLNS